MEVLDGRIVATPHCDAHHAVALSELHSALHGAEASHERLHVVHGLGMYLNPGHMGLVIPDLSVVDEDFLDHPAPFNCYYPSAFRLVAEVTSENWRDDTESKREAYATVGVPVYVIADRKHGKVLVLTRPRDGAYHGMVAYFPGDTVEIPGPLPCQIPADELLRG